MLKKIIIAFMLATVLVFNGCSKDITEDRVQKDIEGKTINYDLCLNDIQEVLITNKDANDDSVKVTADVKWKDSERDKELKAEVYVYYVDGEFKKVERNEWKSVEGIGFPK
ncbi:hypothetical protein [Gemella morbillorum]